MLVALTFHYHQACTAEPAATAGKVACEKRLIEVVLPGNYQHLLASDDALGTNKLLKMKRVVPWTVDLDDDCSKLKVLELINFFLGEIEFFHNKIVNNLSNEIVSAWVW